jgi:hypothetical protein
MSRRKLFIGIVSWVSVILAVPIVVVVGSFAGVLCALVVAATTPFAVISWCWSGGEPKWSDVAYDHPIRKVLDRAFPKEETD